ncbi:hypothetical protein DSECCO2_446720 [anaerobic digester metagenome]
MVYSPQDGRGEHFTQSLALLVNIHICTPAEIDSFEGTGQLFFRCKYGGQRNLAVFFHYQRLSGEQFLHLAMVHIQGGLYHRTFRCRHHHILVLIIKCRSDSGWVTQYKSVAMAEQPGDSITSVPVIGRPLQYFSNVEGFGDLCGNFLFAVTLSFISGI